MIDDSPGHILLVDDDAEALASLSRALRTKTAHLFDGAVRIETACALAAERRPEAAVIDLSLDPARGVESGFELLAALLRCDPSMRIIVLTGHGETAVGVRALAGGAASFLVKPADIDHLSALLRDCVSQARLRRAVHRHERIGHELIASMLVGESPAMKKVIDTILYAGTTQQPVFIAGETGTGKGLCAALIHRFGVRARGPLVRYQPHRGSIDLVNSDLFGHARGAFTGAAEERKGLLAEAENGTLFLDEVDELPLDAQVTLLGVLHDRVYRMVGSNQERRADFRLISASNQRIEQCVETGKVRRDLFHRIAHLRIDLPPLRERLGDIEDLVHFIMRRLHQREGLPVLSAAPGLFDRLRAYAWPGNVRELEAVVEGAAYRARYEGRDRIVADDLSLAHRDDAPCRSSQHFHQQVRAFQRKLVTAALARHGGNQLRAAEELGIDRGTVRRVVAPPTDEKHELSSQSAP